VNYAQGVPFSIDQAKPWKQGKLFSLKISRISIFPKSFKLREQLPNSTVKTKNRRAILTNEIKNKINFISLTFIGFLYKKYI